MLLPGGIGEAFAEVLVLEGFSCGDAGLRVDVQQALEQVHARAVEELALARAKPRHEGVLRVHVARAEDGPLLDGFIAAQRVADGITGDLKDQVQLCRLGLSAKDRHASSYLSEYTTLVRFCV